MILRVRLKGSLCHSDRDDLATDSMDGEKL